MVIGDGAALAPRGGRRSASTRRRRVFRRGSTAPRGAWSA